MKKVNKLFFMSILAISSFVLFGLTKVQAAADVFTLKNTNIVCDPSKLDKGSRAKCYIIGVPSETTTGSVNGYVVRAYTTKYLKLIGAQAVVTNSDQTWIDATSATEQITAKDNMPENLKGFSCNHDGESLGSIDPTTYGCGVFYTIKNVEQNAFTPATITSDTTKSKVNSKVFTNASFGVIGAVIVELDEKTVGNECGEICVRAWRVPTKDNYSDYSTCTNNTSNGCGVDTVQEKNGYDCQEIHYNEPGTFTETGAFASYAILAACALIAVSAITLSKKNNKFSRI